MLCSLFLHVLLAGGNIVQKGIDICLSLIRQCLPNHFLYGFLQLLNWGRIDQPFYGLNCLQEHLDELLQSTLADKIPHVMENHLK